MSTGAMLTAKDRYLLSQNIGSLDLAVSLQGPPWEVEFRFGDTDLVVKGPSPAPPPWLNSTLRAMVALGDLRPGWDSYGAPSIRHAEVISAINVMGSVMEHKTPAPSVVPLADGGIQLEWHISGVDLEIAFHGAGRAEVSCEECGGGSWEGEIPEILPKLRSVMHRLAL